MPSVFAIGKILKGEGHQTLFSNNFFFFATCCPQDLENILNNFFLPWQRHILYICIPGEGNRAEESVNKFKIGAEKKVSQWGKNILQTNQFFFLCIELMKIGLLYRGKYPPALSFRILKKCSCYCIHLKLIFYLSL